MIKLFYDKFGSLKTNLKLVKLVCILYQVSKKIRLNVPKLAFLTIIIIYCR